MAQMGSRERVYVMMHLKDLFPSLNPKNYLKTSDSTVNYNCIAWAAGYNDMWWEPLPRSDYYWPEGFPVSYSVETLCRVFEGLGYVVCDNNPSSEDGYEKVAIYGELSNNEYTHAARQLTNGKWTSKLGGLEDIQHNSLEALCGTEYGTVRYILKRPRN
jgi:hypothetical protein